MVNCGARVRLIVKDMDRTVARLQEVDVSGYRAGLMSRPPVRRMDLLSGNDGDAVHLFKGSDVVCDKPDRHLDRKSCAVVGEHEALQFGVVG